VKRGKEEEKKKPEEDRTSQKAEVFPAQKKKVAGKEKREGKFRG